MRPVGFPDDAPIDEATEQLVAYLDGELAADEVRALERKLGSDAALRAQLRQLQDGWEMLDELPLASSSASLLETTIRMAALEGGVSGKSSIQRSVRFPTSRLVWVAIATAACFVLGLAGVRIRDYLNYRSQLRDLPLAMHLDAFLHAADLELMQDLAEMPEWKQANEIAERLGRWDVSLAEQIDKTTAAGRERLLPTLAIEDQRTVSAAWERFEGISPEAKRSVYEVAARVAGRTDRDELLKTMDRFAVWRESLSANERDLLARGNSQERQQFVKSAVERTTRQWTRERGRELTDDDIDIIYNAIRHIAKLRLKTLPRDISPEFNVLIDSFGSRNQSMDPQVEAFFLRRLFDPDYGPARREEPEPSQTPPAPVAPPPLLPGIGPSAFAIIRAVTDSIRGPLTEDELIMLESVLPSHLAEMIDAAAGLPLLREELLRSWAAESLRRTQWNRSGKTLVERYQTRDANEREMIDLLPTDRLLRSLQSDGFGGRR